jgi:hypothetical protein
MGCIVAAVREEFFVKWGRTLAENMKVCERVHDLYSDVMELQIHNQLAVGGRNSTHGLDAEAGIGLHTFLRRHRQATAQETLIVEQLQHTSCPNLSASRIRELCREPSPLIGGKHSCGRRARHIIAADVAYWIDQATNERWSITIVDAD